MGEREQLEKRGQNLFTGHSSYNLPQMLWMVNLDVAEPLPDHSYPLKNGNGGIGIFLLAVFFAKQKLMLCFNLMFLILANRDTDTDSMSKQTTAF